MVLSCSQIISIVVQCGDVLVRELMNFKRFCQDQSQRIEVLFKISIYFSEFWIQQSNYWKKGSCIIVKTTILFWNYYLSEVLPVTRIPLYADIPLSCLSCPCPGCIVEVDKNLLWSFSLKIVLTTISPHNKEVKIDSLVVGRARGILICFVPRLIHF